MTGSESLTGAERHRLGEVAKRHRLAHDPMISVRDIAAATGKSASSVWRFEEGTQMPRDLTRFLTLYAECVGLTPDTIWREALGIEPGAIDQIAHAHPRLYWVALGASVGVALGLLVVLPHDREAVSMTATTVALTGALVMAALIMPSIRTLRSLIGGFVFWWAFALAQVYTLVRAATGAYIDTYPPWLVTKLILGGGAWYLAYGLIHHSQMAVRTERG